MKQIATVVLIIAYSIILLSDCATLPFNRYNANKKILSCRILSRNVNMQSRPTKPLKHSFRAAHSGWFSLRKNSGRTAMSKATEKKYVKKFKPLKI
jgi:hypothetical protein